LFAYLWRGLILGGAAAAQPGPFQAYLLSQTLKNGWRRSLLAAFAPLISDGPIVALVLLVLTQTPAWFLNILRILGGFFLLYLARGAFRTFKTADVSLSADPEAVRQGLLKAALINALSPAPYIFWSTVAGPIVIQGWRQSVGLGLSFLIGFYATLIGGFISFVTLFATVGQLGPRVNRFLSLVSALALLLFGLSQLWLGAIALLG
jgi:threonine/homoserine/homoserine lactone efflux protein